MYIHVYERKREGENKIAPNLKPKTLNLARGQIMQQKPEIHDTPERRPRFLVGNEGIRGLCEIP